MTTLTWIIGSGLLMSAIALVNSDWLKTMDKFEPLDFRYKLKALSHE